MNIAVDATAWPNSRGYGRHARSLLAAFAALNTDDRLTFILDTPNELYPIPKNVEIRRITSTNPTALAASADSSRSLKNMMSMSRALSSNEFDVVFFPTVYSYVPVFSKSKIVLMIHDVIAEKYPQLTIPTTKARLFWQLKVRFGRWQADAIATVSEYSRLQLVKLFHISPEKISVVSEASDPVFRVIKNPTIPPQLLDMGIPLGSKLLVYVGGFGPHKNLEVLLKVFGKIALQKDFDDIILILVGEYKREVFYSQYQTLITLIEKSGIANRVIFTGYLQDDTLVQLLNIATVLVLPSLMEGFGLPAVEAAACGCPVIATRESPLPSLLGEAGLYINPDEPKELERALIHVLSSIELQEKMRAAGLQAAQSLTWEAAAQQLNDLFRMVAT